MKVAITVSNKAGWAQCELAKQYARQLEVAYLARKPITAMLEENELQAILVLENSGWKLKTTEQEFFFHPSRAKLRIENLLKGGTDNLLEAMQLQTGMKILDATLGLASDALVCAYALGNQGTITGIEASKWISFIVTQGLKDYSTIGLLENAAQRIKVHCQDHLSYLVSQADASYDIVYFDPMFEHPVHGSSNMQPLREFACSQELTLLAIEQALRVARRRVVIKENKYNSLFAKLPLTRVCGGRYSKIKYAVIEV